MLLKQIIRLCPNECRNRCGCQEAYQTMEADVVPNVLESAVDCMWVMVVS